MSALIRDTIHYSDQNLITIDEQAIFRRCIVMAIRLERNRARFAAESHETAIINKKNRFSADDVDDK